MFKLSLAFSAATLVVGQITVASFCDLLSTQCGTVHSLNASSCVQAFTGTATPAGSVGDGDMNTIGCRQKYLDTAPWNTDPNKCRYAGPSGGGRCGAVVDGVCGVAVQACAGIAGASYTDVKSCTDAYATIPLTHQWGALQGSAAATENSLECRVYHAIVGMGGDPSHCSHWGATSGQCNQAVTPDANHYCDTIMYNCNGTNTQYGNRAQCAGVATGLPNTAPQTPDARNTNMNNSLGCREYHAQASKADAATHCQHGGPTGGGACGQRREAWGSILNAAPCRDNHVLSFVSNVAAAVVDAAVPVGGSPYHIALDTGMNTQACRIYHLGVAANVTGHCSHGWLSGDKNCGVDVKANLCTFIGAICGWGSNATWQYASDAACQTAMTPTTTQNFSVPNSGKGGDSSGNNYECRFYHAGVAATYKAGGSMAAGAGALDQFQAHCSHTLAAARPSGCNPLGATTAAPSAAPAGKNSAPEASLLAAAAAVFVSVFSL